MASNILKIEGAAEHNLKNLSVEIPRGQFVVFTGLSGSGKSSLAFNTIYAEGQRRYMDTLSSYARYYMQSLSKPAVENIEGLSPIIAIEQKTTSANPRSTVGTITEIYDFLRLLFAKVSDAYSPVTGKKMVRYTCEQIVELVIKNFEGQKCYMLSPLVVGRKGNYKELFALYKKRGYTTVRVDGELRELADIEAVDRYKNHFIELVVDRLKPKTEDAARIRHSAEIALDYGKGSLIIMTEDGALHYFSKYLMCPDSGYSLAEPQPHTFSFNSTAGYCHHCKGLGNVVNVDISSLIPDRSRSIAEGGILPLGPARPTKQYDALRALARKHEFSLYDPISSLPEDTVDLVIYGSDEWLRVGDDSATYNGVVDDIEERIVCPECGGTRLNKEAGCFRIDGKRIWEVSDMEISELHQWIVSLDGKLDEVRRAIAHDILKELEERTRFLLDVGLDYLSLSRATGTLSGGEGQRIRLATQIGSKLVNVLYILDEPSIGLHQRDNRKLIASLKALRDEGNSVIVVEHDTETILESDFLVDIGPGAGSKGGHLCFAAPTKTALKKTFKPLIPSITLDYIHGVRAIEVPAVRRAGNGLRLGIHGCTGNNLKDVSVDIPLGCLVGVSGVSGSGKSTLINETLVAALKQHFYRSKEAPLGYREITGIENIDRVVEIDQSAIGRNLRSNPATFTGVFDEIRNLFEATPDAKIKGFGKGVFSFNTSGGRCEDCKGAGVKLYEMNFLAAVAVECPTCGGRRYKEDVLSVRYKGKNINDVLEMTIAEAYEFFEAIPKIAEKLRSLVDVGLGYIRLGQNTGSLSGGERQRMKLSSYLAGKGASGKSLFILDEPTTGLHSEDVKVLLGVLNRLVEQGNTVIVIEHNLDVLQSVDYLIDMGPEGGAKGGRIVAQGTPEDVKKDPASVTGPFLAV